MYWTSSKFKLILFLLEISQVSYQNLTNHNQCNDWFQFAPDWLNLRIRIIRTIIIIIIIIMIIIITSSNQRLVECVSTGYFVWEGEVGRYDKFGGGKGNRKREFWCAAAKWDQCVQLWNTLRQRSARSRSTWHGADVIRPWKIFWGGQIDNVVRSIKARVFLD